MAFEISKEVVMPRPFRRKRVSTKPVEHDPNTQRINKVLAAAGLGSRRDVEQLIVQGRVEIDGQTVTNLATRVDPRVSKIAVDGVQLKRPHLVYYALNKPKGVLSTNNDPSGRARVIDFVPDRHRVFSVGRLDRYSEGLMLLTNDGDLAQRLAHPKFRVQKTYFVVVAGLLTNEELAKLKKGVYLAEGVARIDGARIRKTRKTCTELEILLSEGKNREIRRILARAGHKVVLLRRIAIGPLRLAELPVGAVRELTPNEVKALYACTEQGRPSVNPVARTSKAKRPSSSDSAATETIPAAFDKIVTPLETVDSDDFGLGLEQDYQYDESVLTPAADAIEFGTSEDEDWDDDFVSDFESLSSGSVLGYGDEDDARSSHDFSPASKKVGKEPKRFLGKDKSIDKGSGRGKQAATRSARPVGKRSEHARSKGSLAGSLRTGGKSAGGKSAGGKRSGVSRGSASSASPAVGKSGRIEGRSIETGKSKERKTGGLPGTGHTNRPAGRAVSKNKGKPGVHRKSRG